MHAQRFIVFEGGEGVGKSTQIRYLRDYLLSKQQEVLTTREPGGSLGAEAIRTVVLSPDLPTLDPLAEAMLHVAARRDHVAQVIGPALGRGAWVLCDRFCDSTRVYQGVQGADGATLDALHDLVIGLRPVRTVMLHVPTTESQARRAARSGAKDRYEAHDTAFHDAVVKGFAALAAQDPARRRLVEGTGDETAVAARIVAALKDILP